MLGPISFVNHSCRPNVVYKIQKSKMGVVRLVTLFDIDQGDEICVNYGAKYFRNGDLNTCQCPHSDLHAEKKSRSTRNSSRTSDASHHHALCSNKQNSTSNQALIDEETPQDHVLPVVGESVSVMEDIPSHQNLDALTQQHNRRPQRKTDNYKNFWGNEERQDYALKCTICDENTDVAEMMYHMKLHHRFEAQIPCPVCQHLFRFCQSFERHFDKHLPDIQKRLTVPSFDYSSNVLCDSQAQSTAPSSQESVPGESHCSQFYNESGSDSETDGVLELKSSSFLNKIQPTIVSQSIDSNKRMKFETVKTLSENRYSLCRQENCFVISNNLRLYLVHLSLDHGFDKNFFCLFCPRFYSTLGSLRRHIVRNHATETSNSSNEFEQKGSDSVLESETNDEKAENFERQFKLIQKIVRGEAGDELLLRLLSSSSVTLSNAFKFLEQVGSFFNLLTESIYQILKHPLQYPSESCPENIEILCNFIRNSEISTIKNNNDLRKFLQNQDRFVSEEEVLLGTRQETRLKLGRPRQVCVKQTCYFVPISKVLKNVLLRKNEVVNQIFEYNEMLRKLTDHGLLVDIQQAKSFEQNGTPFNMPLPINVEITSQSFKLCLQLYSDDFDPANPIGSRRTIHKITCFYWILRNLPPWLTSQSSAKNVAAVCNTIDLYRYGYKKILSRISKDLESLEQPFNVVTDTGRKITVTSAHFSFVADNAEYQSALGFVKNFSKSLCCERCLVTADEFSCQFDQSNSPLRSLKSFTKNAEKAELTSKPSKGVRTKSYLETKHFSAYRN